MTDANKETQDDELEVENLEEESKAENEAVVEYDIVSYPSDFTLDNLYSQWEAGSFIIPEFQRDFVWGQKQASLLIDSFMMGLPVPPVFLYLDADTKYLVIDGQQRLRSIFFFYEGLFGKEADGKQKTFKLVGLDENISYAGKTYKELLAEDKRKLDGGVLRAINIRQISPNEENTSVYHIFERLNTGGTPLKPQEIRNCVFHGNLVTTLKELNENDSWREIIGKPSRDKHQKDVEFILRLLALLESGASLYEKPMKEFLNRAMRRNRDGGSSFVKEFKNKFPQICKKIIASLGKKPFHVRGPLNGAYLDSVFCTIYENFESLPECLADNYNTLKKDISFNEKFTMISTQDKALLIARFEYSKRILLGTPE